MKIKKNSKIKVLTYFKSHISQRLKRNMYIKYFR